MILKEVKIQQNYSESGGKRANISQTRIFESYIVKFMSKSA